MEKSNTSVILMNAFKKYNLEEKIEMYFPGKKVKVRDKFIEEHGDIDNPFSAGHEYSFMVRFVDPEFINGKLVNFKDLVFYLQGIIDYGFFIQSKMSIEEIVDRYVKAAEYTIRTGENGGSVCVKKTEYIVYNIVGYPSK